MTGGHSLINLGDISKPATVLIERISDAIGGYFQPYQIRRIAKAEADAAKIEASAQIEVSELQRRALQRFLVEEARRQDNMEAITAKALPNVTEGADPAKVEDDWIANFFDKCRLISDDEMQNLWALVLAGEANAPGAYSKRTVDFLASLDKSDAELFTTLCRFAWQSDRSLPLIYDTNDPIYLDAGITFANLSHLDDIGLLRFQSVAGFQLRRQPRRIVLTYFDSLITLEFPKDEDNHVEIGQVYLSNVGRQLAPICNTTPVLAYLDYVLARWAAAGIVCSSPLRLQRAST
ncbi:MAG TPA: DUF2806 domain-containing protein [Gemmatimonadaceae bacterium]|nr:DUF2806 domain-containing protein [Gemmatimonadaceae bacterium]